MARLLWILGIWFTYYVPVLIKIMTPSKHLSTAFQGINLRCLLIYFCWHVTWITVFNVISYFLIHRRPVNNLRCSSQASLYSNVSTVDLLFNFLFRGLRDNTLLAFKDDSVLYTSLSLTVKYSETSFGTELLFSGHPLGSLFWGFEELDL